MTTQDPIALFRTQLHAAAERQTLSPRRRRRLLFPTGLAFAAVVITGAALAASGWLTGQPAPASVISDFGGYTPQLGFQPDPGSSVLVAQDGDSSLYATTNAQGTYCIVASAPWKRPDNLPDGGTCVPQPTAAQTIVAGVVAISPASPDTLDGTVTVLIAGRDQPTGHNASQLHLSDRRHDHPTGRRKRLLPRLLSIELCGNGDWAPTFTAFNDQGQQIAQSTFTIKRQMTLDANQSDIGSIACQFGGLTSAAAPSSVLHP